MLKGFRLQLVTALGWAVLVPAASMGQAVGLAVEGVRDDIPATHVRWTLQGTAQPFPWLYVTSGLSSLRVDQDPYNGLAAIDAGLRTGFGELAALVGNGALTVRGGLSRTDDGHTDSEYLARGQYALPLGTGAQAVTTTFTLEASRGREVAVATAIAERITYRGLAGGVDLRAGPRMSATARFGRDRYSDGNRKVEGYAYGLVRLVARPEISLGYAYAFADADVDNWQATSSTLDPVSGLYQYHYFYYPYFTPVEERGHAGLAVLQWSPAPGATLAASANVPLSSRGQLQSTVGWDTVPEAPPMYGYYTATGVMPLQARASASAPLLPGLSGTLRYEYFSKPYYRYHSGGVGLQFTF